jgi:hypothetical protein
MTDAAVCDELLSQGRRRPPEAPNGFFTRSPASLPSPRLHKRSDMHSFHTDSRLFRDALERLGEASSAPADGQGPEAGEAGAGIDFVSDRREVAPPRVIGRLVALNGTQGVISCPLDTSEEDWSVGHLITIVHKAARLVGAVCDVETHDGRWSATEVNTARVTVELNGEIVDDSSGAPYFHRGVSSFPPWARLRTASAPTIFGPSTRFGGARGSKSAG